MAETTFQIGNYSAVRFRLEPTDFYGVGNSTSPALKLQFKLQLPTIAPPNPLSNTYY